MRPSLVVAAGLVAMSVLANAPAFAVPVAPGVSTAYTVDSTSAAGTSFTYSGTLTGADLLGLNASGTSCLQASGTQYCTNTAGIIVVAGSSGVGDSSPNGPFTFGSLLVSISGVGTEQIFLPTAANGAGSAAPPTSLTLPATALSALGFGSFSVVDPTITFIVSDTTRTDNSGGLAGAFTLTPLRTAAVPEPASLALLGIGVAGFAVFRRRRG